MAIKRFKVEWNLTEGEDFNERGHKKFETQSEAEKFSRGKFKVCPYGWASVQEKSGSGWVEISYWRN